jgi:hypothetical protein
MVGEVDFRKGNPRPDQDERSITSASSSRIWKRFKGTPGRWLTLEVPYREMPQLDGRRLAFLIEPEETRIELAEGIAGR